MGANKNVQYKRYIAFGRENRETVTNREIRENNEKRETVRTVRELTSPGFADDAYQS